MSFGEIKKYTKSHPTASYSFFKGFKDDSFDQLLDDLLEKIPKAVNKRKSALIYLSFIAQGVAVLAMFVSKNTIAKWLKDYSVTKNYPVDSIILWEKYLVYGTLFGISIKALSSLPISFDNQEMTALATGYYGGGLGDGGISNAFSGLGSSVSSLGSTFFSGSFGASGVGSSGGFSGGGGGGGGGGAG